MMFESLRRKIEARKEQEQRNRLQKKAADRLKGFNVHVELENMERALDGTGKAVVTMENKANKQKSVVEFSGNINFDEELWHLTPSELKVGVTIEGKEVFRDWQSDYVKGHEYDSFSKKMKSMKLPSEPYNMVCMMAMTAALPEVEKVETQLRQDREKSKKQEQIAIDVQKKKVSEFLGHDR